VHTVGVCGVVRDGEGRVLLVRTAEAGWELPGGRVEAGEDLLEALLREVREESGCSLDSVGRLIGVYLAVEVSTVMFAFHARSGTANPSAGDDEDSLEAAWFDVDSALTKVTHAREHQRLEDGLADLPDVVYRVYRDG
jgi:8-oxo-dGTP diphosphatase